MEQEICADKMEISRPTFQRILISAREKVADSLINGKAIRIEGGNFTRNICHIKCQTCGNEWTESCEKLYAMKIGGYYCPACGSPKIICSQNCEDKFGRRNCWRHGRNRD